jgi:hypothetical protein
MSGKGAKGLIMGKASAAANKDKDSKKKPISRSSRAGLQVQISLSAFLLLPFAFLHFILFQFHSSVFALDFSFANFVCQTSGFRLFMHGLVGELKLFENYKKCF